MALVDGSAIYQIVFKEDESDLSFMCNILESLKF